MSNTSFKFEKANRSLMDLMSRSLSNRSSGSESVCGPNRRWESRWCRSAAPAGSSARRAAVRSRTGLSASR